ncbi:flagellar motor protein MotB [Brevundimonas sp. LM2]|uniref:OmpA family protein n=1 Tax=Brevundimonas sp. LM2 TaxID=1938605 RepID=UPI000983C6D9|nr:OmpA family protein [Brevundimonas sp. LM2]AQR60313.1 flagellar motor protein MotB [Brevundimonas sp. LM2]
MMTMQKLVLTGLIAGVGLSACSMGPRFRDRDDLVVTPSACAAKRFDVYFNEDQDRLTTSALEAIGLTATQLQGCRIQSVKVLGLASATGAAAENMDLSQRRAVAVAEALTAAGWPAPAFDIEAAGDAGATTTAGVQEPLRRRTEVLVEAAPL